MSKRAEPRSYRDCIQSGFGLPAAIVTLAIAVLLTGMAVPLLENLFGEGKHNQARADLESIAAAVRDFYRHTGRWPTRSAAGGEDALYLLCSGETPPQSNPFERNHGLTNWLLDPTAVDTVDNQLLHNTPGGDARQAYPTTGGLRWRGPYLAQSMPVDPWGRPYLVTVRCAVATSGLTNRRMFALSAGPNGRIDTPPTFGERDEPAGDDLGVLIAQRQP
jgi:type II secretory pathway pseudopilin PulG